MHTFNAIIPYLFYCWYIIPLHEPPVSIHFDNESITVAFIFYKKRPMKTIVLLTLITGFLTWDTIDFEGLPTGKESTPSSDENMEQEVLVLVNTIRQKRGLPHLTLHPDLNRAARYHAKDMKQDRYFEHDSMDRTTNGSLKKLINFSNRLHRFANINRGWAENIALGHHSAQSVMHSWMQSAGHRRNILNPDYHYIGIGYVDGYWVQDFAISVY